MTLGSSAEGPRQTGVAITWACGVLAAVPLPGLFLGGIVAAPTGANAGDIDTTDAWPSVLRICKMSNHAVSPHHRLKLDGGLRDLERQNLCRAAKAVKGEDGHGGWDRQGQAKLCVTRRPGI